MIRITLAQLREKALIRPSGYFEEVVASGRPDGEQAVILDEATYQRLKQKYQGRITPPLKEPSAAEMAANFARAMSSWVRAGVPVVNKEIYEQRAAACRACEFWDAKARLGLGKCKLCGCSSFKQWVATEKCPAGKWPN